MSSDYAEKEREFLDTLEADTGRDLAGWMAAIAGTGLAHRDDIIDWLRQRRFTFDRASWLERIHNNGGRPIYADGPGSKPPPPETGDNRRSSAPPAPARTPVSRAPVTASSPAAPAAPAPPAQAAPPVGDLDALLARGKAFRPLAQHILKTITAAHPGVTVSSRGALITIGAQAEFAVLAVSARDVKLGLALGDTAVREGLEPARLPGAGPEMTHMVSLTDVRRVDAALIAHIAAAAARAGRTPA